MSARPANKWTVAVRPSAGARLRKITKIISLNGGGFSVLMPYHRARSGFMFKYAVNPRELLAKAGKHPVKWTDCAGFTAENRAKLSYHIDGFAQFSSEHSSTIISGRDPRTGEPKGLGLIARPFSDPSQSGPSVGISVWGLEEFELADEREKLIRFEPSDFYYRKSTPAEANTWNLHIYVFPVDAVPPVRFDGDQAVMDFALRFATTAGVVGSIVVLKTIRLEAERVYLGLYVERWIGKYPTESGWSMHGPGNWTANQIGYVLQAIYPRDLIPTEQRPSLDYDPATSAKERRKNTHAQVQKPSLQRNRKS